MNTILYARSVLSPKSMLVWLMMLEFPRSGVTLPEDDSLLARLCMTTPRGLAKARAEIAAAGLDAITDDDCASEIKTFKTDKSVLKAKRNRRYYENKRLKASYSDGGERLNSDGERLNNRLNSDGDEEQKRGSSLSPEVSPAPLPNPNPILPKEGIYPARNGTIDEPEIIPPDPSAIRSAVSGMLGGVLVPMSETLAEPATTPPANAETTGQSAILPPAIRQSRTTHPMESDHGENPSRSATPVPAGGAGTGPVKPRRSPRISPQLQSEFDRFWDVCPRKVGKGAALKAYAAARQLESEPTLLEAMQSYARSRDGEDPQYTCHPATWLNQGRWDDEIPPNPALRGGDVGPSVIRPGKRASSDPVEDAYQAEMAEIAERERRERHVH